MRLEFERAVVRVRWRARWDRGSVLALSRIVACERAVACCDGALECVARERMRKVIRGEVGAPSLIAMARLLGSRALVPGSWGRSTGPWHVCGRPR